MTKFKKGYWNLAELEIQEWIDTKTKGFMKQDVKEFCKRLKKEIRKVGVDYRGVQLIQLINKLSGLK